MKPYKFNSLLVVLIAVLLTALGAVRAAHADTLTFKTSDSPFDPGVKNQGWWSATLNNTDNNDGYTVGRTVTNHLVRNFFTFDLSSLTVPIVSARLDLRRAIGLGSSPTQTLNFFDVSTPAATLNNNVGTSAAIFNDLGTGTSYGSFVVTTSGSSAEVLSFTLNAAAIANINAAAGGFFSIGGSLDPIIGAGVQSLFNFSGGVLGPQQLVIETAPVQAVPASGTLTLLGIGLAGLRVAYWRRKKVSINLV